jgi:hypothetical protein
MKILSEAIVPLDMAGCFVVVARIRVRTGKDDEPNHITLTGTLSYQVI